MLRRKMAARGYENRLREAQRNLPAKPDLSIPIIPILTSADSEWRYISPTCYYAGTGPVAETFGNEVSSSSDTSAEGPDECMDYKLREARLELKIDILNRIERAVDNADQAEVMKLRRRFDQLSVAIAEMDSQIEDTETEELRVEEAELQEELRKARAELALRSAKLTSAEMIDDELSEDEIDENETNENDASRANGRRESKFKEEITNDETEDHKMDEYKMEDQKMDKDEMEDEEMGEDQKKKDYNMKEIALSSFRETIRKELHDELEKAFRKNKTLNLQESKGAHSPKKRKFDEQEQSDTSKPIPSSPDVKSDSPETAWIDTVPLLRELNTHLAERKISSSAEDIMDIRLWIDKGFDTGMRRLMRNQPVAEILTSWDNRYEEEGLNNILRSIVLVYDSIEDLHTLRTHYDRILGELVLSIHSIAIVRDSGRNHCETDFRKLAL
ncbi:hypothetical protein BOTCAL_0219g00120 [Botryotinia calthae]|uniref:Uncharacterized protein n=1 Tax=Botryotinia calthae TaxID=38488 RepID=A0A4Y8D0G6_9HELO|nr:hypothetical protein BOTCAL_0219g00120 [Botryotinia calthae]